MLLSIILVISFGFASVSSFSFAIPFSRPGTYLKAAIKVDGVIEGDMNVKDTTSVTKSGFILPDSAKERPNEGTVVSAGAGKLHPDTGVLSAEPVNGKFDGSEVVNNRVNKDLGIDVEAGKFKIIATYSVFPFTMFRLLNSKTPSFKARPKQLTGSFDIVVVDGFVHALKGGVFDGPNGASFRPNTLEEFYLVSNRPQKSFLCEVTAGTAVPPGCILVHEFGDHFSLQPASTMTVESFNLVITEFLKPRKVYIRDEWLLRHPIGTQLVL